MKTESLLTTIRMLTFVLLLSSATSADDIVVITDFPGGSGHVIEIDQAERIVRLNPTAHKDRGWVCWWYVKLAGITPGEMITLDVGEAPWATPDRAAFSIDNKSWTQTEPGQRNERRIVYTHKVEARECWFAWGPPFLPSDAKTLIDTAVKNCDHASAFELCKTRADRPVPGLIIKQDGIRDEDRRGIWIQARQHAWESGSSWVCRGIVEWLTSDEPRAVSLRKQSVITVIPIMDVDNVAIGAGGKSQVPQDHNRDWSDEPHWNSVRAAMSQIQEMNKTGRFDLFIDLHNPGAGDKNPYYYIPPRERLSEIGLKNLDRFLATSQLEITGPLAFKGKAIESGPSYDKNWQKISKNWVSVNTRDGVVAVTLETAWNTPHSNTEGYRIVGQQLGQAIERHFRAAD